MTSRDFAFWLQGYFELAGPGALSSVQAEAIRKHLDLVFLHEIDPAMGGKEHQDKLNKAHGTTLNPDDVAMRC